MSAETSRTDLRYRVTDPCGANGEAGRVRSPMFGGLPMLDVALDVAGRAAVGACIELRLWDGDSRDKVWKYTVGRFAGRPSVQPFEVGYY